MEGGTLTDERTRFFFEEIFARSYMPFVLAMMISGGFLQSLSSEELLQAQLVIGLCLVGSTGLLLLKMYREGGELSPRSYSGLETLPFKIATWSLVGAVLTATLLRSFGPAGWGMIFTGSVIVMVVMLFIWWRMEKGAAERH